MVDVETAGLLELHPEVETVKKNNLTGVKRVVGQSFTNVEKNKNWQKLDNAKAVRKTWISDPVKYRKMLRDQPQNWWINDKSISSELEMKIAIMAGQQKKFRLSIDHKIRKMTNFEEKLKKDIDYWKNLAKQGNSRSSRDVDVERKKRDKLKRENDQLKQENDRLRKERNEARSFEDSYKSQLTKMARNCKCSRRNRY